MVKLIRDDPGAAADDLVLEVDRVEDARTVRQRFRIPAAQWREFLRTAAPEAASGTLERAYAAHQGFWDWLAGAQADAPPDAPLTGPHEQPVAPGAAWLRARYRDWRGRR